MVGPDGGKRIREARKLVESGKRYRVEEAVRLLKQAPHAKFDEMVEVSVSLDVDTKQSDVAVRGSLILPHGTGKAVRVAVICEGDDVQKATQAGAEVVGGDDLIAKIRGGFLGFDVVLSTPAMMKSVSSLGKVLGPRGLMPNPRAGTVTQNIERTLKEVRAGKVAFRMDKSGDLHVVIGRLSFEEAKLRENAEALLGAIAAARPAALKGRYVKSVFLSSTMGPGVPLQVDALNAQG